MKTFPWVIIAILLLVILYLRECSPKPECPPSKVRVDTLPGDTVVHDTTIYKPTLVYRDTGSTRWLSQSIDTAAILAACMAVNHYRDTLMNDTSALVVVENEVSMNLLRTINIEFTNRRRSIVNSPKYPDYKHHRIFIGGQAELNSKSVLLSPVIVINTKRDHYFGCGYSLKRNSFFVISFLPL
ncbi:MAG: hypothetical protein AB9842_07930 [Bacteroidales bacterium]